MKSASIRLAVIVCLAAATSLADEDITAKPFEYPFEVAVYDLPTSSNGVKYRIYVRPPLREPADGEDIATFYFLDALTTFVPAAAMTSNYEYFNYTPAAYFVGIGYQDEADGVAKEHNRTRDYTPSAFSPLDDKHFLYGSPDSYEGSGGADAFLDVVENEIVPFIERRYEVTGDDRVLVGKSMSGLAAVHSLLTRPGLFRRYVVMSPSIWWDDWFIDRSERYVMRMAEKTATADYPFETRLYLAVGDSEERFGLVTDLHVLANVLRNRRNDNLKVHLEVLAGELHEGIFPTGFMRGIVGVYAGDPDRRPSASTIKW
jgi:predicted alpha/beta superfamily hydrolase